MLGNIVDGEEPQAASNRVLARLRRVWPSVACKEFVHLQFEGDVQASAVVGGRVM